MTTPAPVVDAEFATGNGVASRIGSGLLLDRDLRDSAGERWYWHVGLRAERPMQVTMARAGLLGGFGPAVRRDRGRTFAWLWADCRVDSSRVIGPGPSQDVRISAMIPYGVHDRFRFVAPRTGTLLTGSLGRTESAAAGYLSSVRRRSA